MKTAIRFHTKSRRLGRSSSLQIFGIDGAAQPQNIGTAQSQKPGTKCEKAPVKRTIAEGATYYSPIR